MSGWWPWVSAQRLVAVIITGIGVGGLEFSERV